VSRFALITCIWIVVGTVNAIVLPISTFYWSGTIFYTSYLVIFVCGLFLIRMNFFCRAVSRGKAGQMKVALTFDDGPDPAATPAVLDLLRQEGISAAFFCIGKNVAVHPEIAKRIADEGHLLANHSFTHPWYVSLLGTSGLKEEIEKTQGAIELAAGVKPKYFRPPSGMTGPNFGRALRQTGMTMVGWDVRSFDTVGSAKGSVERIVRLAGDGSIILLHDGGCEAGMVVEIVREAVGRLRARGFGFERLDRLIGKPEIRNPNDESNPKSEIRN
jgi:peptidoglycan/xylan/chitin deacetylase (PgdA/CDA1 family)